MLCSLRGKFRLIPSSKTRLLRDCMLHLLIISDGQDSRVPTRCWPPKKLRIIALDVDRKECSDPLLPSLPAHQVYYLRVKQLTSLRLKKLLVHNANGKYGFFKSFAMKKFVCWSKGWRTFALCLRQYQIREILTKHLHVYYLSQKKYSKEFEKVFLKFFKVKATLYADEGG